MDVLTDYKLLAWLRRGHRRKKVLDCINKSNTQMTPSDISKKLNLHLVKVSVTLKELKEKKLVVLLNPEDHYGRLYQISAQGKKMNKLLQKMLR